MKETGIIMSGNHPRLILDELKTMTRRTYGLEWINLCPDAWEFLHMEGDRGIFKLAGGELPALYGRPVPIPRSSYPIVRGELPNIEVSIKCPYGGVGDRLWVKETWCVDKMFDHLKPSEIPNHNTTRRYFRDDPLLRYGHGGRWRSPRFIPRWASRITLEITEVRVERLQEITIDDLEKEGLNYHNRFGIDFTWSLVKYVLTGEFQKLWDSLNAKRGYGWDKNNWVRVISFRRLEG